MGILRKIGDMGKSVARRTLAGAKRVPLKKLGMLAGAALGVKALLSPRLKDDPYASAESWESSPQQYHRPAHSSTQPGLFDGFGLKPLQSSLEYGQQPWKTGPSAAEKSKASFDKFYRDHKARWDKDSAEMVGRVRRATDNMPTIAQLNSDRAMRNAILGAKAYREANM